MSLPVPPPLVNGKPDPLVGLDKFRLTMVWPHLGVRAQIAIPNTDKARKAALDIWHGATITVRVPR